MTPEQFNNWKSQSETKEVLEYLQQYRDTLISRILELLVGNDVDQAKIMTGRVMGLNELLELEMEDV